MESFARQIARTLNFSCGAPTTFSVAHDGSRVAFLRSLTGSDRTKRLWVLDVALGTERLVADPVALASQGDDIPPEELRRRERSREASSGIVGYAADAALRVAAFSLGGEVCLVDLVSGAINRVPSSTAAVDPRPDPSGRRVAYVSRGAVWVANRDGSDHRCILSDENEEVTWGLAEFVAAEEMDRSRGFWWSQDGNRLAVARVDNSAVAHWYIANPIDPASPQTTVAYPAAGTTNANVTLFVFDFESNSSVAVDWDNPLFPYLVDVMWEVRDPLTIVVQSRDQKTTQIRTVDPISGATVLVREDHDPAWIPIVPGAPRWVADGRLLSTADRARRCLLIGDIQVTPDDMQVRRVVHVGDDAVIVQASQDEPSEVHLWRVPVTGGAVARLTQRPGVHNCTVGGDVMVMQSGSLDHDGVAVVVFQGGEERATIRSAAEQPEVVARPTLLRVGAKAISVAVLFPTDPDPTGSGSESPAPLPILVDSYGGPGAQRVLKTRAVFNVSQWFADQGFAVVVADGRGSPGRDPAWERTLRGDLATAPLEDQVEAVEAVVDAYPGLVDPTRVAIRGWSFGGYLAGLAMLRRGDMFAAGIAGAPVSEWRLYDTHYSERYLGDPNEDPDAYDRSSLLPAAGRLEGELLVIHGLADDNVVVAHSLRLSQALLEARRPHQMLPLSGVTHMTPQAVVAESLLLLQLAFLRRALNIPTPARDSSGDSAPVAPRP